MKTAFAFSALSPFTRHSTSWKLLDAVIFNLIVGNADAHGKNFSILYRRSGPRLAPLYDLLSTVAWPELSPRFAMTIGKRATLAELDAEGWAAFASGAVLGLPFVRRRVADISQTIKTRAGKGGMHTEVSGSGCGDSLAYGQTHRRPGGSVRPYDPGVTSTPI